MRKEMKTQTVAYLLLIVCFPGIRGVRPPGLTSLKKCNTYYHLGVPETDFTTLTKQELNNITGNEWDYQLPSRLAGRTYAAPKQFPFMAALGYDDDGQKKFVCGGTLMSEEFILTAAICIHSRLWGKVKYIRMGQVNLSSSTDDVGVQEFQLQEAYIHPDYKYPKKYHDIALIKLNGSVQFTEYVSPACLEPKRTDIKASRFYAVGWGHLGYDEGPSDHLQFGTFRHYPDKKCQEVYSAYSTLPEGVKPESQICAGGNIYEAHTCQGDIGGPLLYQHDLSNTVYMIAGISSFGKECSADKIPAGYTRVSYYTDWIEKTIWPN